MRITNVAIMKDGGSARLIDDEGNHYIVDRAIGTKTYGEIYSEYNRLDEANSVAVNADTKKSIMAGLLELDREGYPWNGIGKVTFDIMKYMLENSETSFKGDIDEG